MIDLAAPTAPRWTIRDHPDLFATLRHDAVDALQALLARVLGQLDQDLQTLLRRPGVDPALAVAARAFVGLRAGFAEAYAEQLQRGFEVLEGRIVAEPVGELELALVDDQALDEMLASESLVAALQQAHPAEFEVITRRLAMMAGRPRLHDAHNPLSALRLAGALQGAQQCCPLPDPLRAMLAKRYERELVAVLPELLAPLNRRLAEAGVLPNLDRAPSPAATAEDDGPPLPAAEVYQPENRPGIDVRESFNFLRGLLHRLRPASAAHPELDGSGLELPDLRQPLDEPALVALLSSMQPTVPASVLTALADSGAALAELLKQELLQNVATIGLVPDNVRLAQDHEDAIDLVGMLFGVLFEEREFVEHARELLAQLVVPYVKAAVLDLRLFQFTTHPARMLLGALAESLEGNRAEGVHERALQKEVESVVQRLLDGFKLSISVFPKLEREFRDFLVRHRQRLALAERRAAEQQSGHERLEHARDAARQALQQRLAGRAVPAALQTFLTRFWQHHLTLVSLREHDGDGGGDGRARGLAIADRLLALLEAGPGDVRRTLAELDGELQDVLASSGVTGGAARQETAALTVALLGRFVRPKHAPEPLETIALPEPPPAVTPAATPASARVLAAQPLLDDDLELTALRALKLGDWIELVGDDGKTRPLKLSFVSPISGNMVFVNRHGVRVLVAAQDELVLLRQRGQLLLHAQTRLFEHAMDRVRDRLEAELGRR